MIRALPLYRRAGLAFGLIALSTTAGCAHFREAHERVLREQGQERGEAPPPTYAPPPQAAAPTRQPALPPPPQAPVAPEANPSTAAKAAQKAQAAQQAAQDKADRRAERQASKAQAKAAKASPAQPQREPVFAETAQPAPVAPAAPVAPPRPAAPPPAALPPVTAPQADALPNTGADTSAPGHAIIVFANVPGARCGACETLKISVQTSGKVLIERGYGAQDSWRYRRSIAHVRPERAAAFAARLAALRPVGKQTGACPATPTQDQGVTVEWIEGDRHDQLDIAPGCGGAALATLMQAPDLLDLRQLVFPWSATR